MTGFGERARAAIARHGHLCVGIDPHPSLLAEWGVPDTADGARELGLRTVEAAAGRVGFVKPQVSFFERHAAAGYRALEDVLAAARTAGLIVIGDAKRGDIGSTMDAYAQAWLTAGAPLEVDAVTASPFLGVGALTGTFATAAQAGKGVFVLAATTNPEAHALQRARTADGGTVAAAIVAEIGAYNAARTAPGAWADVGFVIGATVDQDAAGLDTPFPTAPILAPGFGHQGATPGQLGARFGAAAAAVIANESRSILRAGPADLAARIDTRAKEYAHA